MNQHTITLDSGLAGMSPFNQQTDSTRTAHRARLVLGESAHAAPCPHEEIRPRIIHSGRSMAVGSNPTTARAHRLIHDADSSQLVNFPYAMTAFLALGGGLLGIGWGMVIDSVGLSVTSFLVTLIGASFYGCSLFDE